MSSFNKKDWVNVLDTGQSDLPWAFRNYQCPKYMFAEDYNRSKVKEDILKSHRIKDAIEKVLMEFIMKSFLYFFVLFVVIILGSLFLFFSSGYKIPQVGFRVFLYVERT